MTVFFVFQQFLIISETGHLVQLCRIISNHRDRTARCLIMPLSSIRTIFRVHISIRNIRRLRRDLMCFLLFVHLNLILHRFIFLHQICLKKFVCRHNNKGCSQTQRCCCQNDFPAPHSSLSFLPACFLLSALLHILLILLLCILPDLPVCVLHLFIHPFRDLRFSA